MVIISKKILRRYDTPRERMAFTTKYPMFLFFLVSLSFCSSCRHKFGRTISRKSSTGELHACAGGETF